jgi:hypothetical protein
LIYDKNSRSYRKAVLVLLIHDIVNPQNPVPFCENNYGMMEHQSLISIYAKGRKAGEL